MCRPFDTASPLRASVGESARFEVIEVQRAARSVFDSLRAEADIGQRARPHKGDDMSLSMKVIDCF
jgi:hypothetical protein